MKITILTLFPEMYESFLNSSIIKRAIAKNVVEFKLVNIRDYTKDKYNRVDTPPVGGGAGLIMKAQPIYDCLNANCDKDTLKICLAPRGKTFNQKIARDFSKFEKICVFCGHYEGFDERIYKYFDQIISIGDFILTGGETASFCLIDAITRLLPGAISDESIVEESFDDDLLEYPQYTEPYEFNNEKIPDILYSGNHKEIKKYRQYQKLKLTKEYRPDLFEKHTLTKEEIKILKERENNQIPKSEIEAIEKGKKFIKN